MAPLVRGFREKPSSHRIGERACSRGILRDLPAWGKVAPCHQSRQGLFGNGGPVARSCKDCQHCICRRGKVCVWGGVAVGGITGGGMSFCIVRWQCVICLGLVPPPPSFFWRYWPFDIGSLSGLGHIKTEVAERERLSGEFLPRFDKTFRGKQKYIYILGGGGGG